MIPIRAAERIGRAQAKYKKWAPQYGLCEGKVWGHGHRNFEILHALKCVLGAPKAFFVHAHSKYIPKSCRLAVSDRKV